MTFLGRGLRPRIIWTTALVSATAMAVMVVVVVLALNAVTHNSVHSTLDDRFAVISSAIESDQDGPTQALESPDDSIDDSTWLYDSAGVQLDGPRAGRRVQAVADGLAGATAKTFVQRRERIYLAGPVTVRGSDEGRGVLVVSQSLEPYESTRSEVLIGLVLLGLLVTAGATAIAAWAVARTLAPVESMAGLADDWSERALDARFDALGSENEIAHLGQTLNVLLDRVAGALRGEQRLTSELAHELRTPLTAIRGEAELLLMGGPDHATRERLDRVVTMVDQMSTTMTTLLAIARGGQRAPMRTTVDQVVAATLDGRDEQLDVTPDIGVEDVPADLALDATTEIAVRALSPLVDNAVSNARSRITLTVRAAARTVGITISDDGPGLRGSDPEEIFVAGRRGTDSPGAGLGLPLARRVARSLGGDVTVTSPQSPTSFTLTLPRI